MSSCEESGTEKATFHSIKKSSPSSSSINSPDSSPVSSKPSRDNLVNSEEECETNDIKALPPGYLNALTPDGVLTPPNDSEICRNGIYEDGRTGKSNGRLAFFKEGVLCLELSHEDEGQTTKWLKIKTRSTFRNIVRVTKEVTIPCPSAVPPPTFTSPSLCHGALSSSHVESCTSHSMSVSDDGSSLISAESPKQRDRSWRKQPVPQRSISSSLQFFMKPASCFLNIKRQNRTRISTEALVRNRRRPYVLPDVLTVFSSSSSGHADNKDACTCGNEVVKSRQLPVGTIDSSLKAAGNGKAKSKLEDLITKLAIGVEEKAPLVRKSSEENLHPMIFEPSIASPSKSKSNNHSKVIPRKRSSKEVETEESAPRVRPIKKTSFKAPEKTILTVPGTESICTRTNPRLESDGNSNTRTKSPLNYSRSIAPLAGYKYDASDGSNIEMSVSPSSGDSNRSSTSNGNVIMYESTDNIKRSRNTSRAKRSSPPCSILKPIVKSVQLATPNASSGTSSVYEDERGNLGVSCNTGASSPPAEEKEETLSPEEQQQFQQQAMSKAISYTINSLLGNGNASIVGGQYDSRTVDAKRTTSKGSNHKTSKSNKPDVLNSGTALHGSLFGINEQDQNSFLRHLLDTSDPIPSSTASSASPPTISNKIGHSLPKNLDRSAINSINKTKSSSIAKSRNSTKVVRSSLGTSSNRNNSNTHTAATRLDIVSKVVPTAMQASAVPSEPRQNMSPYRYLVHSHQRPEIMSPPTVATTYPQHHYAPLLPAHFMPKILPHPYLGQFPAPNFASLEYNGETALNLSQRGENWNSPNQNSYDRASNGAQDLSMRRGSSPYDNLDSSTINSDIPLNLCKRSRPN